MAKKEPKKGAKKNKKGKGKKPKPSKKAALKAPPKKRASKKKPDKKPKVASAAPPVVASVEEIDFSTIMVTEAFRRRVCDALHLTSREVGYVTKTILSIHRTALYVQHEPIGNSDDPLMTAHLGENGAIDLASLQLVRASKDIQNEIRRSRGRRAYLGPESIRLLGHFVRKAVEVHLAERAATDAS